MLLAIHDKKTVGDIQDKFSECFPHLKLVFYGRSHHWDEVLTDNNEIAPKKTLHEISPWLQPNWFFIKSDNKIGWVEQEFRRRFHLNVQIFKKKDGGWDLPKDTETLTAGEVEVK